MLQSGAFSGDRHILTVMYDKSLDDIAVIIINSDVVDRLVLAVRLNRSTLIPSVHPVFYRRCSLFLAHDDLILWLLIHCSALNYGRAAYVFVVDSAGITERFSQKPDTMRQLLADRCCFPCVFLVSVSVAVDIAM